MCWSVCPAFRVVNCDAFIRFSHSFIQERVRFIRADGFFHCFFVAILTDIIQLVLHQVQIEPSSLLQLSLISWLLLLLSHHSKAFTWQDSETLQSNTVKLQWLFCVLGHLQLKCLNYKSSGKDLQSSFGRRIQIEWVWDETFIVINIDGAFLRS